MAEEELKLFIQKVEQLCSMVNSLDEYPERRILLASCKKHQEVVDLAKSWGYEIGRRWGDDN